MGKYVGIRRRAREFALQVLYQIDIAGYNADKAYTNCIENLCPPEGVRGFSLEIVTGVVEHKQEIDDLIQKYSEHWVLDRIAVVDKNILRVAIYELLYCDDLPYKVSINEAVELGKRFGSDDSPSFINGILDKIAKHSLNEKVPCE
jgi:N utilization substance protein B